MENLVKKIIPGEKTRVYRVPRLQWVRCIPGTPGQESVAYKIPSISGTVLYSVFAGGRENL